MISGNMRSESNSSDSQFTDPRTFRALAHPVRLDLLYLLDREGPLIASRCAELLGLTPKVCSFHLNLLGKYGLVEETGEGKGRARPWRLAKSGGVHYVHKPDEEPATRRAADALARETLARDARQVETFIAQRHLLPSSWRNVAAMSSNPLRLNADQLKALGTDLFAVLERYRKLSKKPAPDAHPAHLALYAVPVELGSLTRLDPEAD